MPDAVELGVRGSERRWMAVTEGDDRDPAETVEVPPSGRVDQPTAVAFDERDVLSCVGR